MDDCADNLYSALESATIVMSQTSADYPDNMLIAHSQGGVVARTLNMNIENNTEDELFGGIAFFTSSHGGAQILNNLEDGMFEEFKDWMCPLLLNPLVNVIEVELINPVVFFNDLVTLVPMAPILDLVDFDGIVTNLVCNKVMKLLEDPIEDLSLPHTQSYKVGAQHLDDLASYELDPNRQFKTHRVNFHSSEPDQGYMIWRTLQWFDKVKSPNAQGPFGANDDAELKTIVDKISIVYESLADAYQLKQHLCIGGFGGINFPVCQKYGEVSQSFHDASEFFEDVNRRFRLLTGATVSAPGCKVTLYAEDYYMTQFWQQDFYFPEITNPTQCGNKAVEVFNDEYNWGGTNLEIKGYSSTIELMWQNKSSDGIVLEESQMALPDPTLKNQQLLNSSHMQVRNDANTKAALLNIFRDEIDRDSPSGNWFETLPR